MFHNIQKHRCITMNNQCYFPRNISKNINFSKNFNSLLSKNNLLIFFFGERPPSVFLYVTLKFFKIVS